jgi:parallel beta-helix repeat protein
MRRKKAARLVAILVFTSTFYLCLTILPEPAKATTLYVGGTGPGNYTSIQSALDSATQGNTVFVYNGTYFEHITITKPLSLIGERKETTKIISNGTAEVVQVEDDWVNISGFTIGNRDNYMSIRLSSSENANLTSNDFGIKGVYISGTKMKYWNHNIDDTNTVNGKPVHYWKNVTGGTVPSGAGQVILANCTGVSVKDQNISGVYTGILLGFSSGNRLSNVTISETKAGVELRSSHRNVLENSLLIENRLGFASSKSDASLIANNSISESDYGIWIWESENNTISNNTIFNNSHGAYIFFSDNNTVVTNDFSGSPYSDLWLQHTNGNRIENNRFVSDLWRPLDGVWYKGGWSIRIEVGSNTSVLNNRIWSYRQGMLVWDQTKAIVLNNTIFGGGIEVYGDLLEYWNTHIINTSNTVNGRPVRYWKNITGGTVPLDAGQVIMANCTNVTVENQYVHNTSTGIYMGFSIGNRVIDNIVTTSDTGMSIYNSDGIYIANNTASNNWYGIWSGSSINALCGNNTIADNLIANSDLGIGVGDCSNCTVANNTVFNSDVFAVSMIFSENITVKGNNIMDSAKGLRVYRANNNRIYHNNFIRNLNHAYNDRGPNVNQWDNGYPSGGNYWDDYTGVDVKSGPGQDIPGSDSWGDTPYAIDADSRDRYPSMFPFGYPRTPEMLRAILTGNDLENVTIEWSLSPDDGAGLRTVVGYRIFRNTTYNFRGLHYESIATTPNGTTSFVDIQVGEGDPSNYFYQVCAVDVANRTACPRTQAGKFTRSLSKGMNLVSIPLKQWDEGIDTVFQTVNWEEAWTHDSTAGVWDSDMKSKPYRGVLKSVSRIEGIWLNVTTDSNMTVAGLILFETAIQLRSGWNLVGFPSFGLDLSVGDLKNVTGATHVEGFAASTPPYFLRKLPNSETLEAGNGYWIHLESDMTWIIRNY